jgi:hypothetical protein
VPGWRHFHLSFAIVNPFIPIILGDALGNIGRLRCAGLHDQGEVLLQGHSAHIAALFDSASKNFNALHSLVQIHPELRATFGGERSVGRAYLEALPKA